MKQSTIEKLQNLAVSMQLVTVDDMRKHSLPQLVTMIANKLNELMSEVHRFETDVIEMVETQNKNIQYLLGEGLHLEVATVFERWVEDGTFDTLINQTALKKVNDRIDETNAQLSRNVDSLKKRIIIDITNPPSPFMPCETTDIDVSTKINQMLNVVDIYIPKGEFNITNTIDMPNNSTIKGDGTLVVNVETGIIAGDNCTIEGISLRSASNGSNIGIKTGPSSLNLKIDKISMRSFKTGIHLVSGSPSHHFGGLISNSTFKDNEIGVFFDTYGEYYTFTSNQVKSNSVVGVKIQAGNIITSNCNICDNGIGIEVVSGLNGGHGSITGNHINHNVKSIVLNKSQYGYNITGNNIFYGDLEIDTTDGEIVVCGNTLACNFAFKNTSDIILTGNRIGGGDCVEGRCSVDKTTTIFATNNSVPFSGVKWRFSERMYRINTTGGVPTFENSSYMTSFDTLAYLAQFGVLRRNVEGIIQGSSIVPTLKTCHAPIEVCPNIVLTLDSTYPVGQEPVIFIESQNGERVALQRTVFNLENGKKRVYYTGTYKILGDTHGAFKFKVDDVMVAHKDNVTIDVSSYILVTHV